MEKMKTIVSTFAIPENWHVGMNNQPLSAHSVTTSLTGSLSLKENLFPSLTRYLVSQLSSGKT